MHLWRKSFSVFNSVCVIASPQLFTISYIVISVCMCAFYMLCFFCSFFASMHVIETGRYPFFIIGSEMVCLSGSRRYTSKCQVKACICESWFHWDVIKLLNGHAVALIVFSIFVRNAQSCAQHIGRFTSLIMWTPNSTGTRTHTRTTKFINKQTNERTIGNENGNGFEGNLYKHEEVEERCFP